MSMGLGEKGEKGRPGQTYCSRAKAGGGADERYLSTDQAYLAFQWADSLVHALYFTKDNPRAGQRRYKGKIASVRIKEKS